MAHVVGGLGTSHSPQLSTDVSLWHRHAERDRANPRLLRRDGQYGTYGELAAVGPAVPPDDLTVQAWTAKYERAQRALETLRRELAGTAPDVVIIVGDDQEEMFGSSAIPVFGTFLGDVLVDIPPSPAEAAALPPGIAEAQWAQHAAAPDSYRVAASLGEHVAAAMCQQSFDLCVSREQLDGRSLGHAFTFLRLRLGLRPETAILPIFVNTYYPPNVPTATRCYDFGQALGRALASWPGAERISVVASGGLSHFVVDEDLDRGVLRALARHDPDQVATLTAAKMRSGTSEILNWIVTAGALSDLTMEMVDYIPGYRTPAGTGVGLAFCIWRGGDVTRPVRHSKPA